MKEKLDKLTALRKKEYIKSGGVNCLYCNSNNVTSGPMEVDFSGASQECTCNDCLKEWYDVYKLKTVVEK